MAKQGGANDFQKMEEGIKIGNVSVPSKRFRFPEDRRHKEKNLNDGRDQLWDISESRGDDADRKACQRAVEHDDDETRDGEQRDSAGPNPEIKQDAKVNQKIMGENDQLGPTRSIDIDRKRQANLLDVGFRSSEQYAAFRQIACYQRPHEEADAKVWQEIVDGLVEQLGIKYAERYDHNGHTGCQPKRPDD